MKQYNIYYLIFAAAIIIILKLWHIELPDNQPEVILAPLTALVEILTGTQASVNGNNGYYIAALNIIINKSCSGLNFIGIMFALISFILSGHTARNKYLFYATLIPVFLFSYGAGLAINASRILVAVKINLKLNQFNIPVPGWLHQAEGMFVYLFFLILIYILANTLFTKLISSNEKSV